MTEQGGLDVIEAGGGGGAPRRRWPWAIAAGTALVVAAAVVVVPRIQSANTASNLRWLRDAWATGTSYDGARATALDAVFARTVHGDEVIFGGAQRSVDDEETAALQGLISRSRRHSTGSPDITHLRDEMTATWRDEVAAVAADAAARPATPLVAVPEVTGSWRTRAAGVDRLLAVVLAKHHVAEVARASKVRFAGGEPALARLRNVIDRPVSGSLLVSGPELDPELVDLPHGRSVHSVPLLAHNAEADVFGTTAYYFDNRLGSGQLVLVGLLTGQVHRVHDVRETATTPSGRMWVALDDGAIEQIDGDGRRIEPPRQPPFPGVMQAATDDVIILSPLAGTGATTAWQPATGRTHRYGGCPAFVAASRHHVLIVQCANVDAFFFSDPLHPTATPIRLPPGMSFLEGITLSPDERYLALGLRRQSQHSVEAGPEYLAVLNLRTKKWTLTQTPSRVGTWSASGDDLFLHDANTERAETALQVWSYADPVVRDLRLPRAASNATPVPAYGTNELRGP
ncbi:MAG: hypothetical protein ACJ735_02925 [Actinomycetes bacterium]